MKNKTLLIASLVIFAMKHVAVVCIFFLFVSPTIVSAQVMDGVDILSQSYSISFTGATVWYEYTTYYPFVEDISFPVNYAASSNDGTPISYSANSGPPGLLTNLGHASINTFSFSTLGFAPDGGGIETGSDGLSYSLSDASQGWPTAQASWLFQPTTYNQQITLNIYTEWEYPYGSQNLSVTLLNVTDSNTLLAYSENGTGGSQVFPGEFITTVIDTITLNPNDTYQLSISGASEPTGGDYQVQNVTASFAVVPEPATLVLFPLGFTVFFVSRKRLQVN
jgi:hypothetical protein